MRVLLFLCTLAVLSSCASGATDTNRAQLHLRIGTAHLKNGEYPQALTELLRAEKYDAEDAVIQNNLGLAYFVREKHQIAEKYFRKALVLEPKYTDARNNLGRVLIELGLLSEAIKELDTAASDLTFGSPEKVNANLGVAYFKMADYKVAVKKFRQSLSIRRESCRTNNFYARTLYELKNYRGASIAFDRTIQYCGSSNFDEPYYYSALSHYNIGEREQALARLEEALSQHPEGKFASKVKDLLKLLK